MATVISPAWPVRVALVYRGHAGGEERQQPHQCTHEASCLMFRLAWPLEGGTWGIVVDLSIDLRSTVLEFATALFGVFENGVLCASRGHHCLSRVEPRLLGHFPSSGADLSI